MAGFSSSGLALHGSKATEKVKSDIREKEQGLIISDYHCHPGHKKFECVPSPEDITNAKHLACRRLVITHTTPMQPHLGSQKHAKQPLTDLFIWDVNTAVSVMQI
jgi:hypothetical protein